MVIRLLAGAMLIILVTVRVAVTPARSAGAETSATPSVLVHVTKLRKGSLPKVVTVFGKVEATSAARKDLAAPATAVVENIFVKPGQEVKSGTALIRFGATPETAAAYKKAVSALNNASGLLQRNEALLAQHLATHQQVADAQKAVTDAQASLTALSAEGASTPRTLSAPYDGVVSSISVTPGAIVNAGAALLTIVGTNRLVLRAGAVSEQADEIKKGDTANVSALGGRHTATGTVLLRGSIVDPTTGLVPVEISLPEGDFLVGQTAQAKIITGSVEGYVVPHEAVLVDDSGAPYVVQIKDMVAHLVPVRILLHGGATDVIAGALDPSAALVLAGNYQLKNGMHTRLSDPNAVDSK
jgi:membrane fusion protein (multidrug efflux system)